MSAAWLRAGSRLRRSFGSVIVLALLIGLASALSMASAAGARRTASAYERFRAETHGMDAMIASCPGGAPWPEVDLTRVASLPGVEDSALTYLTAGYVATHGGRPLFYDEPSTDTGVAGPETVDDLNKVGFKVLEGRLPDPGNPAEVAIGYMANADPGAAVGKTIYFHPLDPSFPVDKLQGAMTKDSQIPAGMFGDPIPLEVVGRVLVSGPGGEVRGDSADVFGTPAFIQKYGGTRTVSCQGFFAWLNDGLAGAKRFTNQVQQLTPQAVLVTAQDEATFAGRNLRLSASSLWIFAVLVAAAGLMIFGQALARHTTAEATENPILRALGMTNRQLFSVAMIRAAVIGAIAAVVAAAGAAAASGYFPTGLGRVIEPDPGLRPDLAVIGPSALFVLLAVMVVAAFPAYRASRSSGGSLGTVVLDEGRRPSSLASLGTRSGLPPSAVTGMRLALEAGRGRSAVPVRSAIVGLSIAVAALVAALTFGSSFGHLLGTPRLLGVTFDLGAGNPFVDQLSGFRPEIARDPGIEAAAGGNFAYSVTVRGPSGSGNSMNVWGLEQIKGELHPPVLEGRWPSAPGEVALGTKSMHEAGVGVGDRVTLSASGKTVEAEVVGRTVFPDFGFGPGLGEGAAVTFGQLREFFPDVSENLYLGRYAAGADRTAVHQRLDPTLNRYGAQIQDVDKVGRADAGPALGESLSSVKRTRNVPGILAAVLAAMAVAMLAHTLVSAIRRRRRDLAVLKTLGFTRGQVSAAVAWQASTLVVVSLVIGVMVGVVLGRWAWNMFADGLGVVPEAVVPLAPIALLALASLLLANLIAVGPGLMAGRTRPSIILRAE